MENKEPMTRVAVEVQRCEGYGNCVVAASIAFDLIVLDGDVALFEKRIVVLDTTPPRYLVYPI